MSRQALAIAGMGVAVIGVALDSRWVIWVAMALLGTAFTWRLVARKRHRAKTEGEEGPS